MVSKLRTHKRFSFNVRMTTHPRPRLPSGSRTKLGELSIPKQRDLLLEIVSQVVRAVVVAQDAAASATPSLELMGPKRSRTPWRIGSQGLKPGATLGRMETDALGRTVIDGHEDAGRPLADRHRGRHVRPPHHVGEPPW